MNSKRPKKINIDILTLAFTEIGPTCYKLGVAASLDWCKAINFLYTIETDYYN